MHAWTIVMLAMLLLVVATEAISAPEPGKLVGKRVVILVADMVNEIEALYPFLRLQEEGATVAMAGLGKDSYVGENGMKVEPVTLDARQLKVADWDLVLCPGGFAPDRLRRDANITGFVRGMYESGKLVSSVCHGPQVLISAGILKGKRLTGYGAVKDDVINAGGTWVEGQPVVEDGNLITARWPEDVGYLCRALIARMAK